MKKQKFSIKLAHSNPRYRYEIYKRALRYYYSRIEENRMAEVKPFYYKFLLALLDLKVRYRTYNAYTSDISIGQVMKNYYSQFPVLNDTSTKYYFPELYNSVPNGTRRKLFKNDKERIHALELAINKIEIHNFDDIAD